MGEGMLRKAFWRWDARAGLCMWLGRRKSMGGCLTKSNVHRDSKRCSSVTELRRLKVQCLPTIPSTGFPSQLMAASSFQLLLWPKTWKCPWLLSFPGIPHPICQESHQLCLTSDHLFREHSKSHHHRVSPRVNAMVSWTSFPASTLAPLSSMFVVLLKYKLDSVTGLFQALQGPFVSPKVRAIILLAYKALNILFPSHMWPPLLALSPLLTLLQPHGPFCCSISTKGTFPF